MRTDISLWRQHSLKHHCIPSIILFSSPNELCSSMTESKHIKVVKAVKAPWRRSSRYKALLQVLTTLSGPLLFFYFVFIPSLSPSRSSCLHRHIRRLTYFVVQPCLRLEPRDARLCASSLEKHRNSVYYIEGM